MKLDMEAQLGFARLALEKEMTLEKLYMTLGLEKQKLVKDRQEAATRENNKIAELSLAQATGSGI